jgi:hypothetical protein
MQSVTLKGELVAKKAVFEYSDIEALRALYWMSPLRLYKMRQRLGDF